MKITVITSKGEGYIIEDAVYARVEDYHETLRMFSEGLGAMGISEEGTRGIFDIEPIPMNEVEEAE